MYYQWDTYDWRRFPAGVVARPRGRGTGRCYSDAIMAYDIETTRINDAAQGVSDQAIMYVWQWAINDDVIFGRTWLEFKKFLEQLRAHLKPGLWAVVYVHNLSYEFFFARAHVDYEPESVFSTSTRTILRAESGKWLEWRCSHQHSGYGLDAWLKSLACPVLKLEYDYGKKRWPWTPLTDAELDYCAHDVLGVVQALRIEMERDGDTLATIPLTSTGYIRRELKQAIRDSVPYSLMRSLQPDASVYRALREAFRGGNTHASRYYAGRILHNVGHIDRSSSYPDVLVHHQYPMTPWVHVTTANIDDIARCIQQGYALIVRLYCRDVQLREGITCGCPYIALDKCTDCAPKTRRECDNGRILRADWLTMTVTDIDLRIILDQYDMTVGICEYWRSRYGQLPAAVVDVLKKHYIIKTELKGVDGKEAEYSHSKSTLNGGYGCMAQDPGKPILKYDPAVEGLFYRDASRELEKLLDDHAKKGFAPYQWGVWCTAWARWELQELINFVGADFVYCDTDSVFYCNPASYNFQWYNDPRILRARRSGAYADDPAGERHYMGIVEPEPDCSRFATLGAKKYCWEEADGKRAGQLQITIAGVHKTRGALDLAAHGGMERFCAAAEEGQEYVFTQTDKLATIYNDDSDMWYDTGEGVVHIGPNVCLTPTYYTLSVTPDYRALIDELLPKIEVLVNSIDKTARPCYNLYDG